MGEAQLPPVSLMLTEGADGAAWDTVIRRIGGRFDRDGDHVVVTGVYVRRKSLSAGRLRQPSGR